MKNLPLMTIESTECPGYGTYIVYDENDCFLGSFGALMTAIDIALHEGNYIMFEDCLVVGYK